MERVFSNIEQAKKWLEENRGTFVSLPAEPVVLKMEKLEKMYWFTKMRKDDDEGQQKFAFIFEHKSDFRLFCGHMVDMPWQVNAVHHS